MMLSVIITAYNEGIELQATLRSVFSRTSGPVEAIVVDDASTDGSCHGIESDSVKVIRNEVRTGVAFSRHRGVQLATGLVVCFIDGHQRVATEALNRCAIAAHHNQAIVVPDIRRLEPGGRVMHGARFTICPERRFFNASWESRIPKKRLTRVSSLKAPIYLMPRRIYEAVHWVDGLRNWGGSEAALSLKAFFAGVPILHLCGTPTRHKFKKKLHFDATWDDVWRNQALIARVCFSERTWYEYWLPQVFETQLTAEAIEMLDSDLIRQQRAEFDRIKVHSDAEFWSMLIGQPVPTVLT